MSAEKVIVIGGYEECCRTCRWVEDGGFCGNGASRNYGHAKSDGKINNQCPDWEGRTEEQELITVSRETVESMAENARRMGDMILQLGTMIGTMQKRMDEMEARQRAVTISHGDVKRIQQLIRIRAQDLGEKYGVTDPETGKILRAAMKKDVLKRWGVKDLHDLPAAARAAVESAIGGWVNIRLVMERREST